MGIDQHSASRTIPCFAQLCWSSGLVFCVESPCTTASRLNISSFLAWPLLQWCFIDTSDFACIYVCIYVFILYCIVLTIALVVSCRLAELNVIRQVFNVCSSPIVQAAWDAGTPLIVHGLVYSLKDGLLKVRYLLS